MEAPIEATPSTTPTIAAPEGFTIVTEGKANILFPQGNQVFYNPAQEVNRDLSIIMIKMFQEELKKEKETQKISKFHSAATVDEGITILEALSATGLRSVRYSKEIPNVKKIIANDIDPKAVELIRKNVEFNKLSTEIVVPHQGDASAVMHNYKDVKDRFDVVDVDPYGGAELFMDGAVQCVKDGGLLCITCTDLSVLCGNNPEKCFSKYGSVPLHKPYGHEQALRIVLASLSSHASRYSRYVVPVLSFCIDFYVRVFVRVYTGPAKVKEVITKLSHLHQCTTCESFWVSPLGTGSGQGQSVKFAVGTLNEAPGNKCPECQKHIKIGGPIWTQPIHNYEMIAKVKEHLKANTDLYKQSKKLLGMITVAADELPDAPLFYSLPALSKSVNATNSKMDVFRSAIVNKGYQVSSFHAESDAIKTNAPTSVVMDIMRCWAKSNDAKMPPNSTASFVRHKEPSFEADFTLNEAALVDRSAPRFIPNPAFWGPGSRAGNQKKHSVQVKQKRKKVEDKSKEEAVDPPEKSTKMETDKQ